MEVVKQVIHSSGWWIEVTTWENDGDNYSTKIHEFEVGDSMAFIQLAVKYAQLHEHDSDFSNMFDPTDEEREERNHALEELIESFNLSEEWDADSLDQYFGYALGIMGEDFYTRVVEMIKVYYTPVDIIAEDHTAKFM